MRYKVTGHKRKGSSVKPHYRHSDKKRGKGILKALGEKKSTGHFKQIEKKEGKAAAIGALQNKLAKRRGQPVPYHGKKK